MQTSIAVCQHIPPPPIVPSHPCCCSYSDVVYLDAKTDTYLEEVSSCNIFVVKGRHIKTPPLSGTILPGVTRRSIIELARSKGYTVEEAPTSVHEAMQVGGCGHVMPVLPLAMVSSACG